MSNMYLSNLPITMQQNTAETKTVLLCRLIYFLNKSTYQKRNTNPQPLEVREPS